MAIGEWLGWKAYMLKNQHWYEGSQGVLAPAKVLPNIPNASKISLVCIGGVLLLIKELIVILRNHRACSLLILWLRLHEQNYQLSCTLSG